MSEPAVPIQDDKDWTVVLDHPCAECGYDAAAIRAQDVAQLVRDTIPRYTAALARADAATRPQATTWSVLEYGCHVRDVGRVFDERFRLMVSEDDPHFANWDQDATALEDRYWTQDARIVAGEYAQAAEQVAATLDAITTAQWPRPGRRSNGSVFTLDSLARYFGHDLVHHLHDIEA
ncbi:MAG TPA: DinB family protein [Cellulomonas sp.]